LEVIDIRQATLPDAKLWFFSKFLIQTNAVKDSSANNISIGYLQLFCTFARLFTQAKLDFNFNLSNHETPYCSDYFIFFLY